MDIHSCGRVPVALQHKHWILVWANWANLLKPEDPLSNFHIPVYSTYTLPSVIRRKSGWFNRFRQIHSTHPHLNQESQIRIFFLSWSWQLGPHRLAHIFITFGNAASLSHDSVKSFSNASKGRGTTPRFERDPHGLSATTFNGQSHNMVLVSRGDI